MSTVTAITEASFTFPITVDAGERWVVSQIFVCNVSGVDQTFSLYHGGVSSTNALCQNLPILANDTMQISGPVNLVFGDYLSFTESTGTGGVVAHAYGLKYTLA